MANWVENILGPGTHIEGKIVALLLRLGPDSLHVPPVTDPTAARSERIETRREWPDSAMSDVPDRSPLFELFGPVDMTAWPDLGTAVDAHGRIAAHLHTPGQWVLVDDDCRGEVLVQQLASGEHVVRATSPGCSGRGEAFCGASAYIAAVGRAKGQIESLVAEARAPQDRG